MQIEKGDKIRSHLKVTFKNDNLINSYKVPAIDLLV